MGKIGCIPMYLELGRAIKATERIRNGKKLLSKMASHNLDSPEFSSAWSEAWFAGALLRAGATVEYEPNIEGETHVVDLLATWDDLQCAVEVIGLRL